jgi:hypothetical protein
MIKRRNFFYMLGASVVGILAVSKSPLKLFGSAFKAGGESGQAAREKNTKGKQVISIKENPYSVKRGTRG